LDTVAPAGSIVINDGALYSSSTEVELTLLADDATSGVSQMRLSDDGLSWSTWEPYATSKPWTLPSGDNEKTVYVQYEDHAGNISPTYDDTITLDTVSPSGSIAINDGDAYTGSTAVVLTLSASDAGSGVAEMRFSDDAATWTTWEPYATSKPWTLSAGDGEKIVHVAYRDHAGRITDAYSDTIVLDTLAPISSMTSPASSQLTSFVVTWLATDAHSGVASYDVQYRVGRYGAWTPWLSATGDTSAVFGPSVPVTVVRGETYFFQVRASDHAGNVETYPDDDGHTSTYVEEVIALYLPIILHTGTADAK
jgi:hypothetical protein